MTICGKCLFEFSSYYKLKIRRKLNALTQQQQYVALTVCFSALKTWQHQQK